MIASLLPGDRLRNYNDLCSQLAAFQHGCRYDAIGVDLYIMALHDVVGRLFVSGRKTS